MNKEMNAKQNAKLNMYRTTVKHLDENDAITAASPAFQTAVNKLKATNTAIAGTAQQKSGALTGIAADKSNAKQTLCQIASTIAGAVSAYASANRSETLKQEMNLPVSTLARSRDEALAPRCQMIHDRADENKDALADYGISRTQLSNLQTAIDNYSAETTKPRTAVTQRKTANVNLAALFKENDDILKNQLDKLVELYRPDHPDFVQTYESARIIVDPPVRPRKSEDAANKVDTILK